MEFLILEPLFLSSGMSVYITTVKKHYMEYTVIYKYNLDLFYEASKKKKNSKIYKCIIVRSQNFPNNKMITCAFGTF